jgi:predicted enzyme related to lactoylglutathione lyase
MPNTTRGRFIWHELLTTDPEGAQQFYRKTVGWGTQPYVGSDPPYTMWLNGEKPVGGIMPMPPQATQSGGSPSWLTYLSTPDVDDTVARAQNLGATVHVQPRDIPEVGRFAVLGDPQGAMFAVYTPENSTGSDDETPGPRDFSWHELSTSDPEAAWKFYSELFGWEEISSMDMGEAGGLYRMYGHDGVMYGGMYKSTQPGEQPAWLHYVGVDNADEAVERVKQAGGQVVNGPMDVPGGDRIAQCVDPQGAMFAVHSRAPA